MARIRVAIVDDHEMVRVGLRLSLDAEPDLEVVGEAASGDRAVALARDRRPDVMLLDVRLGEGQPDGPDVCRKVLEVSPRTAVVILTNYRQDAIVLRSLVAGAKGYLTKEVDLGELKRMIRAVHRGGSVLDPQVTGGVISQITAPRSPGASATAAESTGAVSRLGDTDVAILRYLAQGLSNKEIAAQVHLSPYTVKDHLKKIGAVLGVHSRTEIVAHALKRGLV